MKIACSSTAFAGPLAAGTLSQLEWLDACANELEVDGVVFAAEHFPRTDGDYLAQLKKVAADLGLTVAALAADDAFAGAYESRLEIARALGAPLLVARAPDAGEDVRAWGAFTDAAKSAARAAKRANVTLAARCARGTLCESSADLRRLAKDVDSAWLRFAWDATMPNSAAATIASKDVIATYDIADVARFATAADDEAERLNASLARFRGFIVIDAASARPGAYHAAIARFAELRARSLIAVE
jgi:sugar phosphate isomerase/epimerase